MIISVTRYIFSKKIKTLNLFRIKSGDYPIFNGFLLAIPAFLGYLAGVRSHFSTTNKLRNKSESGSVKETCSPILPPNT
jgi:hypothetical protein